MVAGIRCTIFLPFHPAKRVFLLLILIADCFEGIGCLVLTHREGEARTDIGEKNSPDRLSPMLSTNGPDRNNFYLSYTGN
ncbi:unnamed protein product [Pocillopora meandrina]|uniref:Secreted protein n=1 Tax=Pocillopora meandrina TaxID=46732 RepID=A0AAU9VSE0_9CNID|nr:unnamed protein product [Pocillopora meandrina]